MRNTGWFTPFTTSELTPSKRALKMAAQTSSCPMCKAFSIEDKKLHPVDFENVKVKTANGWISFMDATDGYVKKHFPFFKEKTYKVPQMFSYKYSEDRLYYTSDSELTKKEMEYRQQRDAVEKVAQAIYRWGQKTSEAMFIICEFDFKHFLKYVELPKSTRDASSKRDVNVYCGEHDIVVINMTRAAVIFVEVKSIPSTSAKKTRRTQLAELIKQLERVEKAMKCMNRDLSFVENLPMVGLAAVPNLRDDHVDEVSLCPNHRRILLTGNQLEDLERFGNWWDDKLKDHRARNPPVMCEDDYCKLSGRYVGLASVMTYRTLPAAIQKAGNKIWYRGLILPTPEQKEVIDNEGEANRKKVILGDFGTGKSLLLMKKGEMLFQQLNRENIIYVISFSVVSDGTGKVLNEFDNCVDYLKSIGKYSTNERFKVTSFLDQLREVRRQSPSLQDQDLKFPFQLTPDLLKEVMESTLNLHGDSANVHFFFDELPLCIGSCENGWKNFEGFCNERDDMHVWMTFSCCSYTVKKDENYDSLKDHLPVSFSISTLTRCMRMTRKCFNLVRAVRKFKGDNFQLAVCDTVIDGPGPQWYELAPCQCGADKRSFYECECVGVTRLGHVLDNILRELKDTKLNDISIVLHDTTNPMTKFMAETVQKACKSLDVIHNFKVSSIGVDFAQNKDAESGITIVDFWSYKGNESKVVIFVNPYGGPIVWNVKSRWTGYHHNVAGALSRCIAQIFYITWPNEEQEYFLMKLSDELEASAPNAPDQRAKDFKLGVSRDIRECTKGRDGIRFMEYLVSEGVITKMTLSSIQD